MRYLFLLISIFTVGNLTAQKQQPYPSSDSIVITGLVKSTVMLAVSNISTMPDTAFAGLKILNHKGEFKNTYQQLRAVPLRKLLEGNLQSTGKPRDLNSFYFVCKATDGYTAVYSYTELFNPPLEDAVFVVTAYDNFTLSNMPERPVILTLTGKNTAKFGMRGVKSIEVKKAE